MTDYEPLNIKADTKERLMSHKDHPRDTQDDVVNQVLDCAEGKADTTDIDELMDELQRINGRLDELPEETAGKVEGRLR